MTFTLPIIKGIEINLVLPIELADLKNVFLYALDRKKKKIYIYVNFIFTCYFYKNQRY